MLDFKIITTALDLTLDLPNRRFWAALGLEAEKTILKRTLASKDVDGHSFKPYSKQYAKAKAEGKIKIAGGKGYHQARGWKKPDLVLSGKMQRSIHNSTGPDYAKLTMSGRQGFKAWANEEIGRQWFELSQKQHDQIVERIDKWMIKRNHLKR